MAVQAANLNRSVSAPGGEAEDAEIERVARAAAADDFIHDLPQGYDTVVGEGATFLSGGQAQRIALARCALRDPSLLILDEPTSNADLEAEQAILNTLRSFVRGRTSIVVTHRPSLLQLADRIIVLKDGKVVGDGTLEELASRCPTFRKLSGDSERVA